MDTSEWDGSDSVDRTNGNEVKNDDDSSDNESWSSYDNLPEEDFQNKEEGACSENVSDVYIHFVGRRTIWVLTCHGVESFADNISQLRSKLLDVIQ